MELGISDAHGMMPPEYAHRLLQREEAKEISINQGGVETAAAYAHHLGEGAWET